MLPGKDGYALLPELTQYGIPVIFLTAKADIASKVKGLKDGAEDYIVKPFEMLEVMVRLEKVLERHGNTREQIQIEDVTIDTCSHTVTKSGEEIYLKPMEYNCLMMFLHNPNKALTRNSCFRDCGVWNLKGKHEQWTPMWDVSVRSWDGRIRSKPFPGSDIDWRWNFETFYQNLSAGSLCDPDFIFCYLFLYLISLEKQSIQYINNYENSKFQSNLRQLEKGLSLSATQSSSSDSTLQRKILIYRFREIFHDSAVLYQNNEELYNGTIYEFDNRGIQKQMGTVPKRLYDTDSYGYDPVICKINGKTLLLFSYISAESVTKMNYQIVTYKDITNVLAQNQTLFCQAGVLTIFLLLLPEPFFFSVCEKS